MTDRLAALMKTRARPDDAEIAHSIAETHEMAGIQDMSSFRSKIDSIKGGIAQFNSNVSMISDLRAQSLNATQVPSMQDNAQLEDLIVETRALSNDLKRRIAALNGPSATLQEARIRQNQAHLVSSKFLEAIQNYQKAEQTYRSNYRERIERQLRIVNPNATPEEVAAAVEEQNGRSQIFTRAVLSSTVDGGASRAAYREAQERHQDIRKMERTLAELLQLFEDMHGIIALQDDMINHILDSAGKVEDHTSAGAQHTEDAATHMRSVRKKKWICFAIVVVILAAIGIGLGIHFAH